MGIGLSQNFLFEIAHDADQFLDAFERHRVVKACAEASDGAVSLELFESLFLGECEEFLLQGVRFGLFDRTGAEHERNVHAGTVLFGRGAHEQLRVVEAFIEKAALLDVDLFHFGEAAVVVEPVQNAVHHVNGEYRRRVEHAFAVDVGLVIEHGRNVTLDLAENVLADNHGRDARAAHVLLGTGVNHAEILDVYRAGENVRAHVGDDVTAFRFRELEVFGSVDGVVARDVEIRCARGLGVFGRQMRVIVGFRRRDFLDSAREGLRLFQRLVRPNARVDVVGLAVLVEEVHRDHAELERCAAAQVDDFVIFGDAHQFAERRVRVFDHAFDRRRAVADFEDAHARVREVRDGLGGFLGGLFWQRGGSGAEIVDSLAHGVVLSKLCFKRRFKCRKRRPFSRLPFRFLFFEGFDCRLILLETEFGLEFPALVAVDVLVLEEDVQNGGFRLCRDRIRL